MAQTDREAQFIPTVALRVGMFIYLDLGWMQHPFALNSFKISSRKEIDTLRSLGIDRIRWSPEKSDPEPDAEPAAEDSPPPGEVIRLDAVRAQTQAAREHRQALLRAQSESLAQCERHFAGATRAYRQLLADIDTAPLTAHAQARTLVDGFVCTALEAQESAIRLLSEDVGERTAQHAINVTVIALLLGKALGLAAEELATLGTGALLHDIGKTALPERLRETAALPVTAEEVRQFRDHVAQGVALGQRMQLPATPLDIIAQHHEQADGEGYPAGLTGTQIAPLARIVALVNRYDELCNPGNPARAITPHAALALIYAQMKTHFEARLLVAFIRMMGVYPPGSVVELSDGRLALVVACNAARPLKPQVLIYDARIPRGEALVEHLDALRDIGIRRSLKPLQLPRAVFDYLSPRQRICYFFERARRLEPDEAKP